LNSSAHSVENSTAPNSHGFILCIMHHSSVESNSSMRHFHGHRLESQLVTRGNPLLLSQGLSKA
jgi:hypothetical protein